MAIDPVVAKIVVSRRKSIGTLKAEIAHLEEQARKYGLASNAGQAVSAVARVKAQRLQRLEAELAALEQPELPLGDKPVDPTPPPGGVLGRGSGRR